jgi:hypothetical protein
MPVDVNSTVLNINDISNINNTINSSGGGNSDGDVTDTGDTMAAAVVQLASAVHMAVAGATSHDDLVCGDLERDSCSKRDSLSEAPS